MAKNYSVEHLQLILNKYDAGSLKSYKLFTFGYENSNYLVTTDKKKYVIKIFEPSDVMIENIKFEMNIINTCNRNKIKAPHIYLSKDKNLYVEVNKKYAVLMDYVDGNIIWRSGLEDRIAYDIGYEVGKMDKILRNYKEGEVKTREFYEWDMKHFLNLQSKLENLSKSDRMLLEPLFDSFVDIKDDFESSPKGLIHNDIALHNIIVKEGELKAILDFSDLAYSPYVQNLAVAICQCFFRNNWKPKQASIFLKGYTKHRKVSERELAMIFVLICCRYATVIIEFGCVNDRDFAKLVSKQRNKTYLRRFLSFGKERFYQSLNTG